MKKRWNATEKQRNATKRQRAAMKEQEFVTKKQGNALEKQRNATERQGNINEKQGFGVKSRRSVVKKQNFAPCLLRRGQLLQIETVNHGWTPMKVFSRGFRGWRGSRFKSA